MNDVLVTMMSKSLQQTKPYGITTAVRDKNGSAGSGALDFSSYLGRIFTNIKDDAGSGQAPRAGESRQSGKRRETETSPDVNPLAAQAQVRPAADSGGSSDTDNDMDVTGQPKMEQDGAAKLKELVAQMLSASDGEAANDIFEILTRNGIDAEALIQMAEEGGGFSSKLAGILGEELLLKLNISSVSVADVQDGDGIEGIIARSETAKAAVTAPGNSSSSAESPENVAQETGALVEAFEIPAGQSGGAQPEEESGDEGARHGAEASQKTVEGDGVHAGQAFKADGAYQVRAEEPEAKPVDVPARQVVDQIVQAAKLAQSNGLKTMEISLDPKTLGRLSIVLTAAEDGVHATIRASSDATRSMLSQNLIELQNTLKDSGVNMKTIDIASAQLGWDLARGGGQGRNDQPHGGGRQKKLEGIDALFGAPVEQFEEIRLAAAPSGITGYSDAAVVLDSELAASVDFRA